MSGLNKHCEADILEHIDGLTESQLLQNSALIYAMENTTKTRELVDYIRFSSDITLEQLNVELEKVKKLQETAAVTESVQIDNLNNFHTVIESAIRRKTDMKCIVNEHMMHFLENQLFEDMSDYEYTSDILCGIGNKNRNIADVFTFEDSRDKISPCGIAKLTQLMCDPNSPFQNDDDCTKIKSYLIDKLRCTMKYEMCHDEYKDIPVVQAIQATKDYMKDVYHGLKDIEDKLEDIFDDIEDALEEDLEDYVREEAIDAQFNPNPFNVYNLCPFPVGARKLHRSLMDIATAETDDELDDAVIEYARLANAYNVMEASTGGPVSKAIRGAAHASAKATDKARGAAGKTSEFNRDVSKIGEPIIKFVEEILAKMRKANAEDRRNIIIKGGVVPKLVRYAKRGIAAIIAGSFGPTGAVIAVIGLMTSIAVDHYLDSRERTKILRELEDELAIVEEKIDDARGDSNKQKKYELMRIRNKLKTDINRIKLRLRV